MSGKHKFRLLAVCSMAAAFGAQAQEAGTAPETSGAVQEGPAEAAATPVAATSVASNSDAQIDEIIVTARRKWESVQDVPQSVNVVNSDAIEKLNVLKFEDMQALVPGLSMSSGSNSYSTAATIRGAAFNVESGATPTVEFYLNDAPIHANFLFQSMFDVGQVEVLRGPQGTLRGRASPSGSMTATTRRPDLGEFGGYAMMTRTNQGTLNLNGAVNLPVFSDKLAVRLAGLEERSEGNGVRSINSDTSPKADSRALRGSVRFEPIESLEMFAMYQHLEREILSFDTVQSYQLVDPSAPVPDPEQFPLLRPDQRRSVADAPNDIYQKQQIVNAGLSWFFPSHKLSYVGSYSLQEMVNFDPSDDANVAPNRIWGQDLEGRAELNSHELRLSSEERLLGFIDYTAGAFYYDFKTANDLTNRTMVGIPTGPYTVNAATVVDTPIARRGSIEELSFFGNMTFYLGENTELSAGLRHIRFETFDGLVVSGATLQDQKTKENPTVYNLSLSHRWTEQFMSYAAFGTSWRNGADATGIFRPLTPRLTQFTQLEPEDSRTYELGFKADLLDRKLRINASVFRQEFSDYLYRGPSVYYVNLTRTGPVPANFNFVANVDAVVHGAEVEIAYRPIRSLNLAASFSYAKGKIDNGVVACNDFDGDGRPDSVLSTPTVDDIRNAAGGEEVGACRINDRLSPAPTWTMVLQPDYSFALTDKLNGFLRALYTYYPSNDQNPYNRFDSVDAYGVLNLYTGLRSPDGAWELSLFAKNVLNEDQVIDRGQGPITTGYQRLLPPEYQTAEGASIASPYMTTRLVAPREIGASIRYAFGSR